MSIPTSIHAARELIRIKTSGNEFVELVHAATNEDPWGPTGTQMDDVCRAFARGSVDIMEEIKLRLKNREKSWRSCYKSLLLLDHLARNVPESGLPAICSVAPTIRLISQTFYYTGSKGTDHGLSVRERAKKLCDLLCDGALLREEREKASLTRSKLSGVSGGGGAYSTSRYQGYSSSYPPPPPPAATYDRQTQPARSKEEQERYDMELAARMQREEESRAGMTALEAERMFNQQVQRPPSTVSQVARNADLELARRLEEEEEQRRALRGKGAPPITQSGTAAGQASAPVSKAMVPPPKVEPPKSDVLDDLFAPTPVAPSSNSVQQPNWMASAPAPQVSAPVDPFDAFLDTRIQQQQQQQQQLQQHQQPQEIPYGGLQAAPVPQQNNLGMASGGMWYTAPQAQVQMPPQGQLGGWSTGVPMQPSYSGASPQAHWGTLPTTDNSSSTGAYQVPPVAGGNTFQGNVPTNNAGGAPNSGILMEQQMAQFAGQLGGQTQCSTKSLDALMAERRMGQ